MSGIVCGCCGKSFSICGNMKKMYSYKRTFNGKVIYFCGYKCTSEYDKQKEKD